jgi:CHAT domain-containing protein/tetratricopeptide (TPR) repeat protein
MNQNNSLDNLDFEAVLQAEAITHENWRAGGIVFDELKRSEEALEDLGIAYMSRIVGDRRENIELAISYLMAALRILTETDFPAYWARIQSYLGNAYIDRIEGNKRENIETAIAYYTSALRVYTEADFPTYWIRTRNRLGVAYWSRIEGDRRENIETAIAYSTHALRVFTEADFPVDWALTQHYLGVAYWSRIEGNRRENIETAIAYSTHALKVFTEADFPTYWAIIQNNLGIAYIDRIEGNRRENIETAIAYFMAALRVFTEADFPIDWALTQHYLGIAYIDPIEGDRRENIELAISYFMAALKVHTKDSFPTYWSATQNTLGLAYVDRIAGNKEDNLKTAIAYFQAALTIHTPQSDPNFCLITARNLGNLAFKQSNWQLAINAYSTAIESVEQLREWATNDDRKQEIIANAINVYIKMVQACLNLGQTDANPELINKAIEYVELSKARNLADLIVNRNITPKGNIPIQITTRLNFLRQQIFNEQRLLRQKIQLRRSSFHSSNSQNNHNSDLDFDNLSHLRQELETLLTEHIQPVDPGFQLTQQVKPISFAQIQATLSTHRTALIEWYVSDDNLSAFIITKNRSHPLVVSHSFAELQDLKQAKDKYLDSYVGLKKTWDEQLILFLHQIAKTLKLDEIIAQIKIILPDCNQIILVPHRWLHVIPLHALPLANGNCLLDLFSQGVSYAPSVQLLQLTQKKSYPQLERLFAFQNPTEDLEFTDIEVQAIRSQFQPHDDVLKQQQAHKSALSQERLGQANLTHFSCHGYFNFENPELSALLLAESQVATVDDSESSEAKSRFIPARGGGSIDLEKCLTLGEIFTLDLHNCRLVTLSACETGLTDFNSLSDEYIGLPSGFLFAGSPSVVSSLWAVNDLSTSFLMIKFYQNLQEIDSVPIALNQAQLWLRSVTKEELEEWSRQLPVNGTQIFEIDAALFRLPDNSRPFASPYHWAAFCALGSY